MVNHNQTEKPTLFLIRVNDGIKFKNSIKFKFYEISKGFQGRNLTIAKKLSLNDRLYFLQSKPYGGKILGMADYVGLFQKDKSEIV